MSKLIEHAQREMDLVGGLEDPMQQQVVKCIIELITCFSNQNHSGTTAAYVADMFDRLVRGLPITPLQGTADEWVETLDPNMLQNIRCTCVFKDKDTGRTYNVQGKVFREPSGEMFFKQPESSMDVTFPYSPVTIVEETEDSLEHLRRSQNTE